ncbi:MAG TPA: 3-isopropylmalate dehydratase small subunit [Vicinamibacterales bacterium]|jgi:3-isopropylmalate/(R)-2-methylmalate dehydratase small subunit|nr:3-isopropylmalate dehydratase small subunit [Vicinamibacterales bacterium]
MSQSSKITRVEGRGVVVRGDDIDTDRIIPARFLKTITFEGLEQHLFEDDRKQLAERGTTHAIDQPAFQGARILFVGSNFGCGSSREHAPQAIARWGIGAIVGVSFAEIFFGNSLMIGLPCATVTPDQIEKLMAVVEADPSVTCAVDLSAKTISAGLVTVPLGMPEAVRSALMSGGWDATALLVDHYEQVEQVAANLPYVSGWR